MAQALPSRHDLSKNTTINRNKALRAHDTAPELDAVHFCPLEMLHAPHLFPVLGEYHILGGVDCSHLSP